MVVMSLNSPRQTTAMRQQIRIEGSGGVVVEHQDHAFARSESRSQWAQVERGGDEREAGLHELRDPVLRLGGILTSLVRDPFAIAGNLTVGCATKSENRPQATAWSSCAIAAEARL
jgi:hypothetical protein